MLDMGSNGFETCHMSRWEVLVEYFFLKMIQIIRSWYHFIRFYSWVLHFKLKRCIISNIRKEYKCVKIYFNFKPQLDTRLKELFNICKINSKFDGKVEIIGGTKQLRSLFKSIVLIGCLWFVYIFKAFRSVLFKSMIF